jgi:hypothetical protein
LTQSFQLHDVPEVDSAFNTNAYDESSWEVTGGRPVRLTNNLTAFYEPNVPILWDPPQLLGLYDLRKLMKTQMRMCIV